MFFIGQWLIARFKHRRRQHDGETQIAWDSRRRWGCALMKADEELRPCEAGQPDDLAANGSAAIEPGCGAPR